MSFKQYLSKRASKAIAAVIAFAFVATLTTSVISTPAPSASAAKGAATTTQSSPTEQEVAEALRQVRPFIPPTKLHFHGMSRGVAAQPGPPMMGPTRKFPGDQKYPIVLTKSQTAKAKTKVAQYAARGGLVASGASAAICAVIFIEGTPLASAIAGIACGVIVGWYWAEIQDVMVRVTSKRACLQVSFVSNPIFPSVLRLEFAAIKCPKGKNK